VALPMARSERQAVATCVIAPFESLLRNIIGLGGAVRVVIDNQNIEPAQARIIGDHILNCAA
jgi:hypothetical protein